VISTLEIVMMALGWGLACLLPVALLSVIKPPRLDEPGILQRRAHLDGCDLPLPALAWQENPVCRDLGNDPWKLGPRKPQPRKTILGRPAPVMVRMHRSIIVRDN